MGIKDSFLEGMSHGARLGARQALQPNASDRVNQPEVDNGPVNSQQQDMNTNVTVISMQQQNRMYMQYQQQFYSKLRQGVLDLDLMARMMDMHAQQQANVTHIYMQQQQPADQIYIVNVGPSNRMQFDKQCLSQLMQQQQDNAPRNELMSMMEERVNGELYAGKDGADKSRKKQRDGLGKDAVKAAKSKILGADGAEVKGIEAEEYALAASQKSGKRLAMERETGYLAESIEFERSKMMESDGLARE